MGIGDEIMVAGRAAALSAQHGGQPVAIVDEAGRPRVHPVWERNPAIDPTSTLTIRDHAGHRGYMLRWDAGPRAVFDPSYRNRDHPGRIYPPDDARAWARENVPEGCIIVEPIVRAPSSMGKDWGAERWREVVEALDLSAPVVQLGADGGRTMVAPWIKTPTIWHAAAAIERAALVMGPEGGTHHMAGALGVPHVTIFGGFTHPDTTGYATTWPIYVGIEDSPCGRYDTCPHCRAALDIITVEHVADTAYNAYHASRRT
jgi:hypothetical protein